MSINAFPKIHQMGNRHVQGIWDGEVEVTEKLDGSQFIFGKIDGALYMRSKGGMIYGKGYWVREITEKDKLRMATDYAMKLFQKGLLVEGQVFYCETISKPKHNTLAYKEIPRNGLALFGWTIDGEPMQYPSLRMAAGSLDIDIVKLLYSGKVPADVNKLDWVLAFLNTESNLGGPNIEGVVVKAYRKYLTGGQIVPIMAIKYVSEVFKEVHQKEWNRGEGKWSAYKNSFKTTPRWDKAIQHLRDEGLLKFESEDIGALIKEINRDIIDEEKDNITQWLWDNYHKDILRVSTQGFPEYYKTMLLKESIYAK